MQCARLSHAPSVGSRRAALGQTLRAVLIALPGALRPVPITTVFGTSMWV